MNSLLPASGPETAPHTADALVCISNCDKITPGMLMAAMRLNIPTVFVSGGPMEAGKVVLSESAGALATGNAMEEAYFGYAGRASA